MISLIPLRLESVRLILNKWVNSEISRLWITENHSTNEKVILDVESTHPLFPIIKMMQSLSDKWVKKSNQIIDLKSWNKNLSHEIDQLKAESQTVTEKRIQQEMKEVGRQVTSALQSGQIDKLSQIIDIMNAFSMGIPKDTINEAQELLIVSPSKLIKIESLSEKEKNEADAAKKVLDELSLSNRSKLDTINELSYNPLTDVKQSYDVDDMNLKNLGLSILDRNNDSIENDKTISNENNMHQVWNIQITELKKYCKQIEQDCHSVNQRLQDQNAINLEIEHKNVLLESKYQGKANEVEILKKWLKENTEISKELKSILASTTSTLDLTKVNNQNLAKKIKKYKKLVKDKNTEIQSMYKYNISDSVVNDVNNMFGFNEVKGLNILRYWNIPRWYQGKIKEGNIWSIN